MRMGRIRVGALAAAALAVLGCGAGPRAVGEAYALAESPADLRDYPSRTEVNQSFDLDPGAMVDIRGVEGPLTIKTWNENRATLHLVRYAKSQAELDCEEPTIEHSRSRIAYWHPRASESCRRVIEAGERLELVLPRSANVTLTEVEGNLTVGPLDGMLRLRGAEGVVTVEGAREADIAGVEREISLTVTEVGGRGIRVRGVEGSVELFVASGVGADVSVNALRADGTEVGLGAGRGLRGRLGAGGGEISISGIEGDVTIRRTR